MITLNDYLYSGDTVLKNFEKITPKTCGSPQRRPGMKWMSGTVNFCRRLWNCRNA